METPKVPEVKFSKNGYEIRTEILAMAKDLINSEYNSKFNGWEISQRKSADGKSVVTSVTMPEYPGLDKVLEVAERMYAFVNQASGRPSGDKK
jgi:hypothetical protein